MKPWITITLTLCAVVLAFASWLEATTNSFPPVFPSSFVAKSNSDPDALDHALKVTRQTHQALNDIKVINTTPEELRIAFTHYWSLRLSINVEDLTPEDQKLIRSSLQEAHLARTRALTEDLDSIPPSTEFRHLVGELARNIEATSQF
jgi:hypothetical protein